MTLGLCPHSAALRGARAIRHSSRVMRRVARPLALLAVVLLLVVAGARASFLRLRYWLGPLTLSRYKKLFKYIVVMFAVAACGILDYSDVIREYLELVPFPN